MRKILALLAVGLALIASPAAADWTGKNAAGGTITFSNAVDCTIGTCIPIAALVNAAGATLYGTAGASNAAVLSVQGIASGTPVPVSGTVTATPTGTQAISAASSSYASGAFASGAFASGSVASGAFASGALASGSIAAGAQVDLLTMRGTVAAGTVAANSLLTGCIYNSTPITMTNGQGAAVQCSVNGYPTVVVSNTLTALTPGDGITTGTYASGSPVLGGMLLWNGTTYDRLKSSGTGFAGVNPGTAANWGIGATAAAVPANAMYNAFNSGGNLVGVAAATPLPARPGDGTRNAIIDPCEANLQTSAPISITTATTTRIVAPSASNKTYICMLFLTSAAADNVGIVEGTGGTCGTGTAGVVGGTTAPNGPNFAANGGMLLQAGGKVAAAQTAGTNVDLCLITSAATPLAGVIKYVQAP